MSSQILLIGAGHAHLAVLELVRRRRLSGIDITLISPFPAALYSGMVPGMLAGHYGREQASIPLQPLTEMAGAEFIRGRVRALDLQQRVALDEENQLLPFDVVSLDIGPAPNLHALPGLKHAVSIRPIENLIGAWAQVEQRFAGTPLAQTIAIVGGGPAGTEVAAALARRAATANVEVKLTLITGKAGLLPSMPRAAARLIRKRLTKLNVRVLDVDAEAIGPNSVRMAAVGEFYADLIINALPTGAWKWPADSGLKVDRQGFIEVTDQMQSVSHPFVFAAGDCASIAGHRIERSGVYALRSGKILGENLLRVVTKRSLRRYRPQRRALYLLSAGDQYAVGVWRSLVFDGEWVWRWKDRIDRKFIARHRAQLADPL